MPNPDGSETDAERQDRLARELAADEELRLQERREAALRRAEEHHLGGGGV